MDFNLFCFFLSLFYRIIHKGIRAETLTKICEGEKEIKRKYAVSKTLCSLWKYFVYTRRKHIFLSTCQNSNEYSEDTNFFNHGVLLFAHQKQITIQKYKYGSDFIHIHSLQTLSYYRQKLVLSY